MAKQRARSATSKSRSAGSERSEIVIRGAREHNLQDVSLTLPKHKLIVMTGVSGSGKSSLAFDTLYAEGQRRYVESLSSYARQFLGQMPKPEVDAITGLAPSISIQQKTSGRNPRSTVGTITEIYDYLRVLYARVGTQNCWQCGRAITAQSSEQIIDTISLLEAGTKFQILAPVIQGQKGEYRDLFDDLLKQGFVRARVDGKVVQLSDDLKLDKQMRHTIEVVIDRLVAGKVNRGRLAEAVEQALKYGDGNLILNSGGDGEATSDTLLSASFACTHCNLSFEPPSPQLFSFNSPQGMCLDCNGLSERFEFEVESLVDDEKKSIWNGALNLLGAVRSIGRWRKHIMKGVGAAIETDLGLDDGSFLKTSWRDLPEAAQRMFLYGMGDRHITFSWGHRGGTWKHGGTWDGFVADLLDGYRKTNNPMRRRQLEKYMSFAKCSACSGKRLNRQAQAVILTGERSEKLAKQQTNRGKRKASSSFTALSLPEACSLDIATAAQFFGTLQLDETQQFIAEEVLKEIRGRLGFLLRCGLDYLTLDRTAPTLSGGESQRIRLAGQIGCGLVDVVYILDEPSIGLHPRDNQMLLGSLCDLRDQGNTVIVVEHDEDTMRAADHIVDFGPGPGVRGGEVVVEGSYDDVTKSKRSLTGQFLSGKKQIEIPPQRREPGDDWIEITGATHHNLKSVDAGIPLGLFVCVTGVSGSGKSSLVNDILWQVLNRDVNKGKGTPGAHESVTGIEHVDKAIDIDQSPIGRTPRSNPATYVKLFDEIRTLYTRLPEAKIRGYKPGRFSFNVSGGRCEHCEGHGATKLEMDFLADIWVTCPICSGKRFHHETLEVRYKGKNIAEVLDMDVQEALEHFANVPKIKKLLQTLHDVGLDYLKLGQPSPTLSGGEAQRIKLARELGKRSTGSTIYLLDEPTTGLHFADVEKLLEVLHGFVEAGNTVLVIEHNLDVIKTADWLIDVGPDGGSGGGTIIAAGTPEEIAANPDSYTGAALAPILGTKRKKRRGKLAEDKTAEAERWQSAIPRPSSTGPLTEISVRGAAQHNLQSVDLSIPREKMNVFCGPSGSGKTSLAMDTLYAEGQRRYVESLSAYARQFLGQMPKPKVEHIHGLQPSIAIEQKSVGSTPRSTIGTVTEIYDYLRILWCRLGTQHCPECLTPVSTQTTDEVIERLLGLEDGTRLLLLAPQEVRVGQAYERLWENLREQGFARVRIDGETYRIEDVPDIDRKRKHNVEVVVDRATVRANQRSRIADSVETALELGHGVMRVAVVEDGRDEADWKVESYSLFRACESCGRSFEELTPNNFSFNSPLGWCDDCEGIGTQQGTDLTVLISDPQRSILDAAIAVWPDPQTTPVFRAMLQSMADTIGIQLDVPFAQLDPVHRRAILYGTGDRWFDSQPEKQASFRFQFKGLFPALEEASRVSYSHRRQLSELVGEIPCPACDGSRLRDDAAAVRFQKLTLQQLCEMPLDDALAFLQKIKLTGNDRKIAGDLLDEARHRLSFLVDVGLDYLTLSRSLPTLSGGETQRIRLAGQIGRALTGVTYVLDEPTIGLHPRDNARLLAALQRLRDLGNTLILVEHDREVIESADRVFDFGPGSGRFGGTVTDEGTPKQIARRKKSLTGEYLGGRREIVIPAQRRIDSCRQVSPKPAATQGKATTDAKAKKRRKASSRRNQVSEKPGDSSHAAGWLELTGARLHNLRNVDLRIPLGTFTVVTGVSGSGKSSLIENTLAKALLKKLHRAGEQPGPYDELLGLELVNKAIVVDQSPLGATPKSNPGTYTGVFDHIRELYSKLPDAKVRGYKPGRFSFNRAGGRCEACEGDGQKRIEMHFLPDVWVECDECRGRRYNRETLAVQYRGHSIADVLEMSIGQCLELFDNIPKIRKSLSTLCAIGLDYLTLGQSATTLSGGEAQRVKLASELARPNTGQTIYILDEPTTGLHFDDIDKLLKVLESLVEAGNTVVVIEHNLDVIKTADWIIDLGPEAGSGGGWIVTEGTPEDVVAYAKSGGARAEGRGEKLRSHTGEMLAPVLEAGTRGRREIFDAKAEAKKREGDVSLSELAKDAKMPWEADGRKWHTQDRLAHSGKACRWEGSALELVVDELLSGEGETGRGGDKEQTSEVVTKAGRGRKKKTARRKKATATAALRKASELLAESEALDSGHSTLDSSLSLKTNWNDSSTVEVTGEEQRLGWFMHALTRDEWLLKLYFRVERNCFNEADLAAKLDLKPVDEIDELPVYGRGERVRVKNKPAGYQEVLITVHWQKEIDTPEFRQFLHEARSSYESRVASASTDVKDVEPWKVLGRKWHLMQKGFPAEKRPRWKKELLETLFNVIEKVVPDADVVWNERQFVRYRKKGEKKDWLVITTKRRGGIDLVVTPRTNGTGLGDVASLVTEHETKPGKDGRDTIRLRVTKIDQVRSPKLREFLERCL
jgi:excinuclease ABC subunit A